MQSPSPAPQTASPSPAHTPGPWSLDGDLKQHPGIPGLSIAIDAREDRVEAEDWPIAYLLTGEEASPGPDDLDMAVRSLTRANARRIVACVNACEGINPEAVPDLLRSLKVMVERIEYYSGLKKSEQPNIEDWEYTEGSTDMENARAAIAKAKGGAA